MIGNQMVNPNIVNQELQPMQGQKMNQVVPQMQLANLQGYEDYASATAVNILPATFWEKCGNNYFGYFFPKQCPKIFHIMGSDPASGKIDGEETYQIRVIEDCCCIRWCCPCRASQHVHTVKASNKQVISDNERQILCCGIQNISCCSFLQPWVKCCLGGPNYDERIASKISHVKPGCDNLMKCYQGVNQNKYKIGIRICPCQSDPSIFLDTFTAIPITDYEDKEKGRVLLGQKKCFPCYCVWGTACGFCPFNPFLSHTTQVIFPKDSDPTDKAQLTVGYLHLIGQLSV